MSIATLLLINLAMTDCMLALADACMHEARWRAHLNLQRAEFPVAPLFAVSSLAFLISMFLSSLWSPSEVSVATKRLKM